MVTPDQNGVNEQFIINVPAGQKKIRLDAYLAHQVENATRNKVQQAIKAGMVTVNGKTVKPSAIVLPNDVIVVTLPRPAPPEAIAENIPLEIIYEDEALLIVNKPAGMVTHPAYGNYTGTLVNALLYHCNSLSKTNTALRPGIVHRLDRDTSGLLIVAKTDAAHNFLAKQFAKRSIEREYWAVVWGVFKQEHGVIEASLGRSKSDRKKVAVVVDGKHAVTEYETIRVFDFLSLVRLKLKTGRTHQIRVHLAHSGHPVFGDSTYGGRNPIWGGLEGHRARHSRNLLQMISRQALHAKTIGFVHPVTKEFMKFNSDLPEDMKQLIEKI